MVPWEHQPWQAHNLNLYQIMQISPTTGHKLPACLLRPAVAGIILLFGLKIIFKDVKILTVGVITEEANSAV